LLALARKGYSVYGVDISTDLLARAEEDMAKEPPLVRSRVQLVHGDIHDLHAAVDRKFDVVLCHGLLMYLPSLEDSLRDLTAVLNRGAMISLLTRNRASIAMRAGMSSDWQAALDGFDARYYDNRVAVEGTRADEPSEVSHLLGQLGMEISAWFGVRLFTDHWSDMKPPENFDLLLAAEEEAGKRDPYRQLTSLTHVIARRVP
jgi:SAM-dependent methyltransferase